jgi:hypothetical protein
LFGVGSTQQSQGSGLVGGGLNQNQNKPATSLL